MVDFDSSYNDLFDDSEEFEFEGASGAADFRTTEEDEDALFDLQPFSVEAAKSDGEDATTFQGGHFKTDPEDGVAEPLDDDDDIEPIASFRFEGKETNGEVERLLYVPSAAKPVEQSFIRKHKPLVGAAIAVAAVVLVAGVGYAVSNRPSSDPGFTVVETPVAQAEPEVKTAQVTLATVAEGYDASTSTAMFVRIQGTSEDTQDQDFGFWYRPGDVVELPYGTYTVTYVSPVNADNSFYLVPDAASVLVGEEKVDGSDLEPVTSFDASFTLQALDTSTTEQADALDAQLALVEACPSFQGADAKDQYVTAVQACSAAIRQSVSDRDAAAKAAEEQAAAEAVANAEQEQAAAAAAASSSTTSNTTSSYQVWVDTTYKTVTTYEQQITGYKDVYGWVPIKDDDGNVVGQYEDVVGQEPVYSSVAVTTTVVDVPGHWETRYN